MRKNCSVKLWNGRTRGSIVGGLLAALTVVVCTPVASAQDTDEEVNFNLIPNPTFVDCLRAGTQEEPQAHVTVIRGKLNDTLILDLDGIKPGLAFDLFTVKHSAFLANGSSDPGRRCFL